MYNIPLVFFRQTAVGNNNQNVLLEFDYDATPPLPTSDIFLSQFSNLDRQSNENEIYSTYRKPSNQETSVPLLWEGNYDQHPSKHHDKENEEHP